MYHDPRRRLHFRPSRTADVVQNPAGAAAGTLNPRDDNLLGAWCETFDDDEELQNDFIKRTIINFHCKIKQ